MTHPPTWTNSPLGARAPESPPKRTNGPSGIVPLLASVQLGEDARDARLAAANKLIDTGFMGWTQ